MKWHARTLFAAVAYKDADRTSEKSKFGTNEQSWTLECSENTLKFCHINVEMKIPGFCSKRIGIFLDYKAVMLRFYQVSDLIKSSLMLLIFEFRTTFFQPLFPCIGLNYEWYDNGVFAKLAKSE